MRGKEGVAEQLHGAKPQPQETDARAPASKLAVEFTAALICPTI